MKNNNHYDVIIIGGSFAGLSAAMALGRSLRDVLIIDGNQPCNRQTPQSHNFITHDGTPPLEILEKAKKQVFQYPTIHYQKGLAVDAKKNTTGFAVSTESGDQYTAKKLLIATGVKDIMPDIKGFSDCWGISVLHCPYCHGYEYKHQPTAVMADGDLAFHFALMVQNLTQQLSLLTNGQSTLSTEQKSVLASRNITLIEHPIHELTHQSGHIEKVEFENGESLEVSTLYAKIPFTQTSHLAEKLGCNINEHGYLQINEKQQTSVPGIYAAGDNTSPERALSIAIAAGTRSGAALNMELVMESIA
ncbi:NAD(P)/FAD-dependent oxidoreductase [Echinicola sp. CAU 1574]|uniref:NAD(P)/FAD-dependent oxidoreductase n=1 Tax=Echinicola arenosa TaxID=2774144 RepID=A0ABR9ASM6_9BACT|nr:NAD(P)/FAD-dependent oxidoreductase [Echinicola arenosa]MBD8490910.1 NAD(P)/FAD-dependent oxidoreductase [Echinicola arenosa]